MARLLKKFAKKFMHGDDRGAGGSGEGGSGQQPVLGIEDLLVAAENMENEEAEVQQGGGHRGRGGRRGGRAGRARRGVGSVAAREGQLDGYVDMNLSAAKLPALSNFRILPDDEVHVSTQSSLAVSIFSIIYIVFFECYILGRWYNILLNR